jgi:tetratricopeptide (TPR) repeat protein
MRRTTALWSTSSSFPEPSPRAATTTPASSARVALLALAASALLAAPGLAAGRAGARAPDDDRIAYVRPYATALQQAREANRILIVRPFPIGGVRDGSRDGRWCPLADYMRAVTLSDERVVALVNRRFVFTYFSLVDWAELSDAEAKHAIVRLAPEYGEKVRRTPPTFLLSPDAEVLATLDTAASPEAFLRLARRLLAEHPEYDRPTAEEAALLTATRRDPPSRLLRGRLQLELARVEEARATLETLTEAAEGVHDAIRTEALYVLGHLARLEGDVELARRHFSRIDALPDGARAGLALDLRAERAHLLAAAGDWDGSLQAWSAIEADAPLFDRKAELLYAKGLAYYHTGKRRNANYTWVRLMTELPEDRYYQKARLAAMGPSYSLPSPDLLLPGAKVLRHYVARGTDPSRLPGSDLGYGTSSDGRMGTDETPERFLLRAYHDHDEVRRRLARARAN